VTEDPVTVWAIKVDANAFEYCPPLDEIDLCGSVDILGGDVEFRGVSWDRLPTILAAGVDVEPTTDPIFVSDFAKAWEYGGLPKVVMAFDGSRLQRTYREVVLSDATDEEIAQLMIDYPTRIEVGAGDRLWLTRFSSTDPRAATDYEGAYARWIPGDPFDALLAILVFTAEGMTAATIPPRDPDPAARSGAL
jgi:hypothetical protein